MTNVIDHESGNNWTLYNADSCEVMKAFPEGIVDFSIHSPPFASLYTYSDSVRDLGNCQSTEEFIRHYEFIADELLRITVPGRLAAVHCMDLPKFKWKDGFSGREDFPGDIIRCYQNCGWIYHSRITIWKDPVLEQQRTKAHGLLHKTLKKDSSKVRQGGADYLLLFLRRPEDGKGKPVMREKGLRRYVGESSPLLSEYHPSPFASTSKVAVDGKPGGSSVERIRESNSIEIWRRYAENTWWDLPGIPTEIMRAALDLLNAGWHPGDVASLFGMSEADAVWVDIDQTDTLNARVSRDGNDERHICPLQLGLIKRAVHLWSNPGDVIFTPFAGVGSELVGALSEGRKAIGVELKEKYFKRAVINCQVEEEKNERPVLFGDDEDAEAIRLMTPIEAIAEHDTSSLIEIDA